MSEVERNLEVPASTRDEALSIPAALHEETRGAPHNAKGALTSLRRHERVPQDGTQLERNPELPATTPSKSRKFPCILEEALLRCNFSKESPRSLLELERVLETIHETPEVSPYTRPHS